VVLEAAFEAGVDNGYYDVVVSVDEGVRTISLDAITAEQVDETFTRDDSRRAEADAIAGGRRSLGRVVRDLRAERPNERGTRVRSDGDDAAVHTLDRNGNAREHRRGLADEPTPR
jgi:hypothetical protein